MKHLIALFITAFAIAASAPPAYSMTFGAGAHSFDVKKKGGAKKKNAVPKAPKSPKSAPKPKA